MLRSKHKLWKYFFANHEKLPLEDTYWLLSKVSTSFSDFLNLLKPMDL